MKKLRQILSIAFAVLVFISSSNFSFGMHHCGGEVKDVAFLSQADGCGQQLPPCHRKMMASCCSDEMLSYSAQSFDVNHTTAFIIACHSCFIESVLLIDAIIPTSISNQKSFTYYDPPLRSSDHVIINQVFRI